LAEFKGSHPQSMLNRVRHMDWSFNFDVSQIKLKTKDRVLLFIEKMTGWRVGEYKNYIII
jgi:hypothetical protein